MPIQLLRHPINRGLGETIRDALRAGVQMAAPEDILVTMDADNTHDPALIPTLVKRLNAGNDIVIASRYRAGSSVVGVSVSRRLMSYIARILFQAVFPIHGVRDYTCGFRAYKASALRKAFVVYGDAFVTERSFACMAEILIKLSKMRINIAEEPIVLRYDRKEGASKMRVFWTILRTLRMMAKMRLTYSRPGS
jgi:dolichol-phosphate mannosyltransferase